MINVTGPSTWQPYVAVDTQALGIDGHVELRDALREQGVGDPTSDARVRFAIGTANGHSLGLEGEYNDVIRVIGDAARRLGLQVVQ